MKKKFFIMALLFCVTVSVSHAADITFSCESKENFPYDIFRKLAKADFFKVPFPKEVGGLGLDYPVCATVAVLEELSYISNSVAAIYDVHCILAGNALMYGSDVIKEKYLKPMTVGEKIGCFATTEPTAS